MHVVLVIAGASVIAALALLIVALILYAVAMVAMIAVRELQKARRGDQ